VLFTTDSFYAHVAVQFSDCIIEAIAPKVLSQPQNKYDQMPTEMMRTITFCVDEETYQRAYAKAESYIGYWYGLDKCLCAGAHDLFGDRYSDWLADEFKDIRSICCSGLGTQVGREIFPDLLSDESYNEITPEALKDALVARKDYE
jgi:hypothetical protein